MYLNRLTLIGFIGADAEVRNSNNGSQFTVSSVATKRSWKNAQGDWESRTEWHRCLNFGKLGEFAASLKKGAHVQVEGELRSREYEKEGVIRRTFECRVESILKLDRAARQEAPDVGENIFLTRLEAYPPGAGGYAFRRGRAVYMFCTNGLRFLRIRRILHLRFQ